MPSAMPRRGTRARSGPRSPSWRWCGRGSRRNVSDVRLVVVTTGGARPIGAGAHPVAAAVWGSVRSAQSEHPDRFVLIDEDPAEPLSADRIAAVLRSGSPRSRCAAGNSVPGGRHECPRRR